MRARTKAHVLLEVLRSLGPMLLIELWLHTTDLPTTCRRLRVGCDLQSSTPPASEAAVLPRSTRATVLAVDAVASRWPAGDTCLRRCLLLGHRLRRLEPVLRIGVQRSPGGSFAAHSWLELHGATLDATAARYAVLGTTGTR